MAVIKEKLLEIIELIQDMMDEGIRDYEIDEYLKAQLPPEDYTFYHSHKDIIMDMLGMNESLNESFEDWFEENQNSEILWDEYEEYESENADDLYNLSFKEFCKRKYDWLKEHGEIDESLNEKSQSGIIRVFGNKRMKGYDSHDFSKKAIIDIGKTYTLRDSTKEYYITQVKLYDGTKGYVWPGELEKNGIDPKTNKRNKFNENLSEDDEYIMPPIKKKKIIK